MRAASGLGRIVLATVLLVDSHPADSGHHPVLFERGAGAEPHDAVAAAHPVDVLVLLHAVAARRGGGGLRHLRADLLRASARLADPVHAGAGSHRRPQPSRARDADGKRRRLDARRADLLVGVSAARARGSPSTPSGTASAGAGSGPPPSWPIEPPSGPIRGDRRWSAWPPSGWSCEICNAYLFNAVHKGGPTWRQGTAVHYVRPPGPHRHLAGGLDPAPHEPLAVAPVFLERARHRGGAADPDARRPGSGPGPEPAAALAIVGLHTGFQCFINLGIFSWAMSGYAPFLLLAPNWEALARFAARRPRRITAYFDADCGVCFQLVRLVGAARPLRPYPLRLKPRGSRGRVARFAAPHGAGGGRRRAALDPRGRGGPDPAGFPRRVALVAPSAAAWAACARPTPSTVRWPAAASASPWRFRWPRCAPDGSSGAAPRRPEKPWSRRPDVIFGACCWACGSWPPPPCSSPW